MQCYVNKVPLTSWNGAVECEEDCGHKHTDYEIDLGCQGPGGCQGTENRINDDNDDDQS